MTPRTKQRVSTQGLRRYATGEYGTRDGKYRVVHGWADDRRWTVLRLNDARDACDVLDTFPRLRDARTFIEECER